MAKSVGQVNVSTGKVETRKVKKVKEVNLPITIVDTPAKRVARALWG